MPARHALVVASKIKPGLEQEIAAGAAPRRDFLELARELDATLIHQEAPSGFAERLLWKLLGPAVAHAWIAFRRRREYEVIHSLSEDTGLPLAMLLKFASAPQQHVMVAHHLTPLKKRLFFLLRLVQSHLSRVIVYGSTQHRIATQTLGLPEDRVEMILHAADHEFWRPAKDAPPATSRPLICAAGREFRDYGTLIAAVEGMPLDLVIATGSPWSRRNDGSGGRPLPANVRVQRLSPSELRDLYRSARFVVVPLHDVTFQAGSLVMYEAMACGRAVIASRTRGQEDILQPEVTGLYVPPGDVAALRAAIERLLANPEEAERMGARARALCEDHLNLAQYNRRVSELLREVAAAAAPLRRESAPAPGAGHAAAP